MKYGYNLYTTRHVNTSIWLNSKCSQVFHSFFCTILPLSLDLHANIQNCIFVFLKNHDTLCTSAHPLDWNVSDNRCELASLTASICFYLDWIRCIVIGVAFATFAKTNRNHYFLFYWKRSTREKSYPRKELDRWWGRIIQF